MSSDEVQSLPVDNPTNIVNFISGSSVDARGSHIRGGREDEIGYYVDNSPIQDPIANNSMLFVSTQAVNEMIVFTGGFNAEYGKVMSGAVNVITREGAQDYFGSVEMITDNLAGDWVGAKSYDYNIYDVALGGPLLPGNDRLTFFVSGERRWQRDRAPKPVDVLASLSVTEPGSVVYISLSKF